MPDHGRKGQIKVCILSLTAATVTLGTVLADIAVTAAVAGGTVATISGIQQAKQQEANAKYQADVAEANARLANREGERIDLQADQKRAALQRDRLAKIGAARAGYAANGVVLGNGTVLDYEADVAQTYDLDLANLNYDVANQKWQKRVQAQNYQSQANASRATAKAYGQQATYTGIGGAISTLGDAVSAGASGYEAGTKIGKLF